MTLTARFTGRNESGEEIRLEATGSGPEGEPLYELEHYGLLTELELLALARFITEAFGRGHSAAEVQKTLEKMRCES